MAGDELEPSLTETAVAGSPPDGGQGEGSSANAGQERAAQRSTRLIAGNLRKFGVAQIATRLSGLLVVVLLVRLLSQADFGRYTVAIALVAIMTLFVELGMGGYLLREGSQRPEAIGGLLGHVLLLRAAFGVVAIGVLVPIALLLDYDRVTFTAVLLLAAAALARVFRDSYLTVLQTLERVRDATRTQSQQAIVIAVVTAGAALTGFGVVGVSGAVLAISLVTPIWAWRRLRRRWSGNIDLRLTGLSNTLVASAIFSASHGLHVTLNYLDAVMIQALQGNVAAGLYGAAYRVLIALLLLPAIYVDAVSRSISHYGRSDRVQMRRIYDRGIAHLTAIGVPLGLGGALLSEPILLFLFGPPYVGAATALSILLPGAMFAIPAWIALVTAYGVGRERTVAAIFAIAVLANGTANFLLIPTFGIEGAAAASFAAEAFVLTAVLVVLWRAGVPTRLGRVFGKPLVGGALMCLAVWPVREAPLALPVLLGAITYFVALLAVRAFEAEDREMLRALFSRS